MKTSIQKIFEFYEHVLKEVGIYDAIYRGDDLENIFDECFKNSFGFWPDDYED